jgi:hypothetical protein
MNGAERIVAERRRQIDERGYTAQHDQEHMEGELAWAAACYAAPETIFHIQVAEGTPGGIRQGRLMWHEPWPQGWKRDTFVLMSGEQRVRQLEKAGALIAAEIDRILAVSDD